MFTASSSSNAMKNNPLPTDRGEPGRDAISMSKLDAEETAASSRSLWSEVGCWFLTLGTLIATDRLLNTAANFPVSIFVALVAVVYSAYSGGLTTGLISAAIVVAYQAYFLSPSGELSQYTDSDFQHLVIVAVSSPAMVWMVAALKSRSEQVSNLYLQRARDSESAHAKFRGVLESAPDAIVIADGSGRIVLVNSETESLFGYKRDELLGKTVESLMPERFRRVHLGHRAVYSTHPKKRPMGAGRDLYGRRKNGSEFPIEIAVSPLETEEGLLITSVIRDITHFQLQEKLLKESQQQYEGLINSIDGIVWEADPQSLHFTFVSNQAERLLGYPTNQWLMEPNFWQEHIHPEDRASAMAHCRKAAGEKRGYDFEYRMTTADGRTVWLKNILNVEVENDRALKLQGMMVDISESKKLTQQIKERATELEKANKAKNEFLGHMSHDLRSPLTDVVGYTGMIRDQLLGPINPEQEKALGKIVNRSNDLLTTINSILNITKLGIEEVKVQNREIKLEDFLSDLKAGYKTSSSEEVNLTWDYPEKLPVLKTDRSLLKQILQNLIQNALKFTKKGSIRISVLCIPHSKVVFRVADTGIGIPKHSLPVIFDRFRQADSPQVGNQRTQRLGLYTVKKLTELLGGKIEVESQPGKGSAFTVTIPFQSA
jgi:protein-histidine pros-kinase